MRMQERPFEILGAAFGAGGVSEFAARGPAELRSKGVFERIKALGVAVLRGEDIHGSGDFSDSEEIEGLKNYAEVKAFCDIFSKRVLKCYTEGHRPVILGGDHSVSIASISAASSFMRSTEGEDADIGLLWIDAHPDINTAQTTPSGHIHGMTVATLLGIEQTDLANLFGYAPKIKPENIAYIGLRDVDPGEREFIKKYDIAAYSMKEIDLYGLGAVTKEAIDVVTKNTVGFSVSFDLDVCDPHFAPAVGTPVRGGLTLREAHLVMELIAEQSNILSLGLMELNPHNDREGETCELGISMLESALGKTIL
jgi:arginase